MIQDRKMCLTIIGSGELLPELRKLSQRRRQRGWQYLDIGPGHGFGSLVAHLPHVEVYKSMLCEGQVPRDLRSFFLRLTRTKLREAFLKSTSRIALATCSDITSIRSLAWVMYQ